MKNFCLILLLIVFVFQVSAQEKQMSNPDQFRVQFAKTADATKNIAADFVQEKHSVYFKEPLTSKGKFCYDQSGQMRWEQNVPEKHIILITGEELRIQQKGKVNTYNLSSNKQLAFIKLLMVGTVNGDLLNSGKFDILYLESSTHYVLKLTPKDKRMRSMFNEIKLSFNKQTMRLLEIKLTEPEGDFTWISFGNTTFNTKLNGNLFTEF
jgi:outer membrane lipoprotein-sorting protein